MKQKIKIIITLLTMVFIFSPATAFAFNPYGGVSCQGASSSTICAQSTQPAGNPIYGSGSLIGKVTLFIAYLGGIAAVILIIVGGIQFTTAGGNPERVSSAKRTIIYSVTGLVIIALAELIVQIVISNG
jgi:hypothetical protein